MQFLIFQLLQTLQSQIVLIGGLSELSLTYLISLETVKVVSSSSVQVKCPMTMNKA